MKHRIRQRSRWEWVIEQQLRHGDWVAVGTYSSLGRLLPRLLELEVEQRLDPDPDGLSVREILDALDDARYDVLDYLAKHGPDPLPQPIPTHEVLLTRVIDRRVDDEEELRAIEEEVRHDANWLAHDAG